MIVRAHAKINLGLRVLGRRADGYHALSTIFHRVDLFDTLRLDAADGGITLECDAPGVPTDDGNLCVRAARLLLAEHPERGVRMRLHKRIPIGAGLGGGSADAAAVLRFLPSLLDLRVTEAERFSMALRLGSDVPYFLRDGSAVARGRGELLTHFPFASPWWIVLVNPGIHVSTAWAYGSLRPREAAEDPDPRALLRQAADGDATALSLLLTNDFEEPVMAAHPEIRRVRVSMREAGAAGALMSGSGSTVFGLFETESAARDCAASFPATQRLSVTAPGFVPESAVASD